MSFLRRPDMERRLLIVDDQMDVARTLARALRARGFATSTASSCQQALSHLGSVDCAIVDIDLPDGTGLELAPKLLATSAASVVFFSGCSDPAIQAEAGRFGPFVTKNAGLDVLFERIIQEMAARNPGVSGSLPAAALRHNPSGASSLPHDETPSGARRESSAMAPGRDAPFGHPTGDVPPHEDSKGSSNRQSGPHNLDGRSSDSASLGPGGRGGASSVYSDDDRFAHSETTPELGRRSPTGDPGKSGSFVSPAAQVERTAERCASAPKPKSKTAKN